VRKLLGPDGEKLTLSDRNTLWTFLCRLIDSLGFAAADGIIKFSLVHYNTLTEVDHIIGAFQVLGAQQTGTVKVSSKLHNI
jgi:hypothetical protein